MTDNFEVEAMVEASRLLWHKTRERAIRKSIADPRLGDVLDCMAAMCGQPTPICFKGVPDWEMISATPVALETTIRHDPAIYLTVLLCHGLPPKSALKRHFEELCRRLGRNVRIREFLLSAESFFNQWAKDRDDDISDCPFPKRIDDEAKQLLRQLADELVAWSIPSLDEIEAAFRAYIRDHPPTGYLAYVYGDVEEAPREPVRRLTPPLHTFLPKIACLCVHRALSPYRAALHARARAKQIEQSADKASAAVSKILDQYRDIIRAAGLSPADIENDVLNFDGNATAEEMIHGHLARSR